MKSRIQSFFYKNKILDFGKIFKNKLRTNSGLLSTEHKKKVSRLVILKIKQNIRTESSCYLYYAACRLVLPSHFKLVKLFNDHILFEEYKPFLSLIFAWLYKKSALKQVFFLSIFCCIITLIFDIIGHYFIMESFSKNWGKMKLRTIYL